MSLELGGGRDHKASDICSLADPALGSHLLVLTLLPPFHGTHTPRLLQSPLLPMTPTQPVPRKCDKYEDKRARHQSKKQPFRNRQRKDCERSSPRGGKLREGCFLEGEDIEHFRKQIVVKVPRELSHLDGQGKPFEPPEGLTSDWGDEL